MLADYVVRGAKAGLVAGLLFALFVALVANPLVAAADGDGHAADHQDASEHDESVVSGAVTSAVSVGASVLWGLLLGVVVFGVGDYFLEPIVPGSGAVQSYLLAAGGFVTVSGAPWLLLPPTVPGVERAIPTQTGMVLYAGMVVAGAICCLLSALSYDRLRDRWDRSRAAAAALTPLAVLAVPAALSPFELATGSLPPALASGVLGTVVFGQLLCWLALAATHARLDPVVDDGLESQTSTTDPVAAD